MFWIGERDSSIIQELLRGIDGIQQNTTARSGKQLSPTQFQMVLRCGAHAVTPVIEQGSKWHMSTRPRRTARS